MIVRRAALDEVRPLQLGVLRPNGPLPGDTVPGPEWVHLGAFDGRSRSVVCVGAASIGPVAWPATDLAAPRGPTWQLRSMVVAGDHRGRGIGADLLAAARAEAAAAGASSLWAAARLAALGFYERDGWRVVGSQWDKPGVGLHRYVWLPLSR